MANGVNWCISVGTTVKTKPGVTAGAIRQGINTRFDEYSGGLDPATSPPDKNIASEHHLRRLRHNRISSTRVIPARYASRGLYSHRRRSA